jgi:hypothetical protein
MGGIDAGGLPIHYSTISRIVKRVDEARTSKDKTPPCIRRRVDIQYSI